MEYLIWTVDVLAVVAVIGVIGILILSIFDWLWPFSKPRRLVEDAQLNPIPIQDAYQRGWTDCLKSVQASITTYPQGGGDTGIMRELDRLVDRLVRAEAEALFYSLLSGKW